MCQGVAQRAGGVASALVGGASGHCQKLSLRFFSGERSPRGLVYGRGGGNGRHRSSATWHQVAADVRDGLMRRIECFHRALSFMLAHQLGRGWLAWTQMVAVRRHTRRLSGEGDRGFSQGRVALALTTWLAAWHAHVSLRARMAQAVSACRLRSVSAALDHWAARAAVLARSRRMTLLADAAAVLIRRNQLDLALHSWAHRAAVAASRRALARLGLEMRGVRALRSALLVWAHRRGHAAACRLLRAVASSRRRSALWQHLHTWRSRAHDWRRLARLSHAVALRSQYAALGTAAATWRVHAALQLAEYVDTLHAEVHSAQLASSLSSMARMGGGSLLARPTACTPRERAAASAWSELSPGACCGSASTPGSHYRSSSLSSSRVVAAIARQKPAAKVRRGDARRRIEDGRGWADSLRSGR